MPSTKEIIEQVESLPVEERALLADSILKTLNPSNPEIDRKWGEMAKRRLDDLLSGRVMPLPGNEVLSRARERFEK